MMPFIAEDLQFFPVSILSKKVKVGKDQEKAQSEKKIPTPKTEVGKKLN